MIIRITSVSSILLYLGIGFLTQYFFYGDDFTLATLINGSQPISTYAHILAWPIYAILYFLFIMFWVAIVAIIVFLGDAGYP